MHFTSHKTCASFQSAGKHAIEFTYCRPCTCILHVWCTFNICKCKTRSHVGVFTFEKWTMPVHFSEENNVGDECHCYMYMVFTMSLQSVIQSKQSL